MKMKKPPSEANSGRVTNPGNQGKENDPAALAAQENREAKPHGRSQNRELMDKNRIEPERSGDSPPAKRCGQRRQGASRWHNTPKASGVPLEVNSAATQEAAIAAASKGEAQTGMAGAQRRQCDGATCNYPGIRVAQPLA
jgi:hypothetical protein